MSATLEGVIDGVKSAIAGIDGTGSYNFDLSGTDLVQIADIPEGAVPYGTRAWIQFQGFQSTPDGACLGHYRRTATMSVIGTTTDGTTEKRLDGAAKLLEDFARALESDRTLGGLVYDLTLTNTDVIAGAELGIVGPAFCAVVLSLTWSERAVGA